MKRSLVLLGFVSLCISDSAIAAAEAEIAEATRPMDEGVAEVAVVRLEQLVPRLSGSDAINAKRKLLEALVAAGRPADALRLAEDPAVGDSSSVRFLRAQALAALNRFEDSLLLYRQVSSDAQAAERLPALFGCAEMLRALGRSDEAGQVYRGLENDPRFGTAARLRLAELLIQKEDATEAKRVLDKADPKTSAAKREKRFLRARLELLHHRPEKAITLLDSLVKKPEGGSRQTVVAALFVIADAHLELGTPESGDDYLEDFIERRPEDQNLAQVFAKLDQLYRAERKPSRVELEKWAREPAQPRRGFARWYLAQNELRANRLQEALRQFEQIRNSTPVPAALAPALLQYARLQIDLHKYPEALSILSETRQVNPAADIRAQIDFESARATYGMRNFREAAMGFQTVAQNSASLMRPALFNASLAWIQTPENSTAQAQADALAAHGDRDGAAEVMLEQALAAAQRNERNAAAMLREFIRRFPNHSRVADAYLALAELAFHGQPLKLDDAEKNLAAARAARPSEATTERADYLAIFLADARGADSDRVIAAAEQFLRAHPQSSISAEVRMKLAECHFRRHDFASAQTQFETLAQQNPTSPLAEKALFFAAQSAAATMATGSLDRALELLTQVVKLGGDLRWAARNEQAAIERRLGKPQDAQVLYDEVLKSDARAAEKREALCGKADIFLEQTNADVANLDRAIATYEQLAQEASNQPQWRNQALFKEGVCLEKKANPDAALATFYRILEFEPMPDKSPEFFWFYKAGFNAARLLEEQQKWNSAASVYEKLVAANGPRSDEARARLTQLRLEHFLWQD